MVEETYYEADMMRTTGPAGLLFSNTPRWGPFHLCGYLHSGRWGAARQLLNILRVVVESVHVNIKGS